jgi:hypothetical protein
MSPITIMTILFVAGWLLRAVFMALNHLCKASLPLRWKAPLDELCSIKGGAEKNGRQVKIKFFKHEFYIVNEKMTILKKS